METSLALCGFGALAQPTRLEAIRLLVRHEPAGLCAGDLAQALAVPANTLSAHLKILAQAGLVRQQRVGRSIRYRAELATLEALIGFLVQDCCGGQPGLCVSSLPSPLSHAQEKACA